MNPHLCRTVFFVLAMLLCSLPTPTPSSASVEKPNLVITEVFYRPAPGLSQEHAVWFEVYNAEVFPVPIPMVSVSDHLGNLFTFWPRLAWIPAQGFAVLGATEISQINGGIQVDAAFGTGITISPAGGTIEILSGTDVLDRVEYGDEDWPVIPQGVSATLESSAASAFENNMPEHWCPSKPDPVTGLPYSPGSWGHDCDSDGDGLAEDEGDCNDNQAEILPGVLEKCNNVDDDCDGLVDPPEAMIPTITCMQEGVCKDTLPTCDGQWGCDYPETWQSNETICDGLDNDCDGDIDEGLLNDCGECGPLPHDLCDGVDNDCDGMTDEDAEPPEDDPVCKLPETGVCQGAKPACDGAKGWICALPSTWQTEETLCDGLDNDCDGDVDEGYETGAACATGQGACRITGVTECAEDQLGVICQAAPWEAGVELCGDGVDNDCDGEVDEGYDVGQPCQVGQGACQVIGKWVCASDRLSVLCSEEPGFPESEICGNAIDDNCDGSIDEAPCEDMDSSDNDTGCSSSPAGPDRSSGRLFFLLSVLLLTCIFPLLFRGLRRRRSQAA